MNKDLFVINKAYFNPLYIEELYTKVGDLKKEGYTYKKSDVESKNGNLIEAAVLSPDEEILDLGSILLDGERIKTVKPLVTIKNLVSFFAK